MIRKRLLKWFVLIALLPVIGVGVGTCFVSYANGRQQSIDRLESVAARKQLAIQGWVESLGEQLIFISQTDYSPKLLHTALRLGNENKSYGWYYSLVRKQLESFINQSQQIQELFLIDLQGDVVVSTNPAREGRLFRDQAVFLSGKQKLAVQMPFNSVLATSQSGLMPEDRTSVIAVIPVFNENQQLMGVIALRADIGSINNILSERTGLGETGKAFVVNNEYNVLPGTAFISDVKGLFTIHTAGIDTAIRGAESGSMIYTDALGHPVIGVYRLLSGTDSVLLVEQDIMEAFRAVSATIALNLIIAFVAVCAAVAASLLMTHSIADPIVNLARTATEIARGDLNSAAEVKYDDEIGALAHAFNSMTAQLRELINSLESRVEERTLALKKANTTLLPRVVEMIQVAFDYYHVQIFLLNKDTDQLNLRAMSGNKSLQHRKLDINMPSINSRAVQTGKVVLVDDVLHDPGFLPDDQLPQTRSELVIPLHLGEQIIGTLDVHDARVGRFTDEDNLVIQSLGDQIAVAIENARLYDQNRELAILEERTRLARELHDSVTQSLYSLVLLTEGWRRLLSAGNESKTEDHFRRIGEIAQQALREMRLLIYELKPFPLTQEGLVGSLWKRLDAVEKRVGIDASVVIQDHIELPADDEESLYWITLEALNNSLKHAAATKETIQLYVEGKMIVLEITDNGRGFDPNLADHIGGMGLSSMRERARKMNGILTIESAKDRGTVVQARVPCR
jgi:signal transduction histidine kinase